MVFHFSEWAVDIDTERTRAWYRSAAESGCDCLSCQNFRAAEVSSEAVEQFFRQLGVEYRKSAELCIPYCETPEGPMLYDGWYHLCGTILAQPVYGQKGHQVDKDFSVWFSPDCALLEEGFPAPAVEMRFHAKIPWVLDQKAKQEYLL